MKKVLYIFLFIAKFLSVHASGGLAKASWGNTASPWSHIKNLAAYQSLTASNKQVVDDIHTNVGLAASQAVSLVGTAVSLKGNGTSIANSSYYGGGKNDANWFLTTAWLGQCATLLNSGTPPYQNMTSFNLGSLSQVDQSYITNHLVPALQSLNSATTTHVDTGAYTASLSFTPGSYNGVIVRTIYNNTKTSFEIFQQQNQIGTLKPGKNTVALYGAAHEQGDIVFVPTTRGLGTVRLSFKKGPDVVTIANTTLPTSQQYSTEYPPAGVGADSEFICVQITKDDFPQGSAAQMKSMIQRTQCINTSELTAPAYISLTIDDNMTVVNQGTTIDIDQSKIPMFYISMHDIQIITDHPFPFLVLPDSMTSIGTLTSWINFLNIIIGAVASDFGMFFTPSYIQNVLQHTQSYFIIKEEGNDFGSMTPSQPLSEMDPNYGRMQYVALNTGSMVPFIPVTSAGFSGMMYKGPKTNYMDMNGGMFGQLNAAIKLLKPGEKITISVNPGTGNNVTVIATNDNGTGIFANVLPLGNDSGDYGLQYQFPGGPPNQSLSFKHSFTISLTDKHQMNQPIQTVTSGLPGTEYLFTSDIPSLSVFKFYLDLHKQGVKSGTRKIPVEFTGSISIGGMLKNMKAQPKLGANIWQKYIDNNELGAVPVSIDNGKLMFNLVGKRAGFAKSISSAMTDNPLLDMALRSAVVALPLSFDPKRQPESHTKGKFKGSDLVANLKAQSSNSAKKRYFSLSMGVWSYFLNSYKWEFVEKQLANKKSVYFAEGHYQGFKHILQSPLLLKALLAEKQVDIAVQDTKKTVRVNSFDVLQAILTTSGRSLSKQGNIIPAVPHAQIDIDVSEKLTQLWFSPVFDDGTFAELALQGVSSADMNKITSVLAQGGYISFSFTVEPGVSKGADGVVTAVQRIYNPKTKHFESYDLFTYTFSNIKNNKHASVPSTMQVKSFNVAYQTSSMPKLKDVDLTGTTFEISAHRLYVVPAAAKKKTPKKKSKKTIQTKKAGSHHKQKAATS